MDAASHTGVDNMREIMDGMKYVPVSSRYKIYIIDEVHMLSKAAFNALLKTLEEPPAHVKFIFATTEADRVPITVRSRCQRFDLRRISAEQLATYFRGLTDKEGVTISDDAMHLIAQAADGSARDGLSLLDQAIALGGGAIEVEAVRDMLGLSDYGRLVELFEAIARGQTKQVLTLFDALYNDGADPAAVVRSIAEFAHELTRLHVTRGEARLTSGEGHREAMLTLARSLSMAQLSRFWQAALSGLREVLSAFQPSMAAVMVLLLLCYLSQMPDPGQLVEQMRAGGAAAETPPASPEPPPPAPASAPDNGPRVALAPSGAPVSASQPPPAPTPPVPPAPSAPQPKRPLRRQLSPRRKAGRRIGPIFRPWMLPMPPVAPRQPLRCRQAPTRSPTTAILHPRPTPGPRRYPAALKGWSASSESRLRPCWVHSWPRTCIWSASSRRGWTCA